MVILCCTFYFIPGRVHYIQTYGISWQWFICVCSYLQCEIMSYSGQTTETFGYRDVNARKYIDMHVYISLIMGRGFLL